MMMAASKTCACDVRFRSAAPVVGSDTLYEWIGDDSVIDMGSESTPHYQVCRCEWWLRVA